MTSTVTHSKNRLELQRVRQARIPGIGRCSDCIYEELVNNDHIDRSRVTLFEIEQVGHRVGH